MAINIHPKIKSGDAELVHDEYDGDYWLIKLKEIYD